MKMTSETNQDDHLKMYHGNGDRELTQEWGINNFLTQVTYRVHFKTYVWI